MGWYGLVTNAEIAKRLEARFGGRFTADTVKTAAHAHGITRSSAQPYLTIAQAAEELGVDRRRILNHCHRHGLKILGRSAHGRFVSDEAWARLQQDFKPPPEPTIGVSAAARRLFLSLEGVHGWVRSGRLNGYRVGGRVMVSVASIEREERHRRGERRIGEPA